MEQLRNAIQAYFEPLQGGAQLQAEPSFLRALHIVYEQLEQQLQRSVGLGRASLELVSLRRQQLERQLAQAHVDLGKVDRPALHALLLAQSIRREAAEEAALIGYAYALELAWRPARLATEPEIALEEAALPAAMSGARAAANGLCRLLELFEEREHHRGASLRLLNLEAGTHPIPRDLREVEAALRAGERTYRDWAYYYARFGERGVRFTRSDSAWIASVARRESHAAQDMFDWLARLLAARGMPRLLFEHHLGHLHAELVRALPDRAADYDSLLSAAAELERARTGLVDIATLAQQFRPAVDANQLPLTAAEAGRLLVAAVLDEHHGISSSVASLVSWLGDAERFGASWSGAVERFLQLARTAILR